MTQPFKQIKGNSPSGVYRKLRTGKLPLMAAVAILGGCLASCTRTDPVRAGDATQESVVGVTQVRRMPLQRDLTLSSELVPFQEIDVYAKESGFVQKLDVDYGTRVKKGQLMAVLEIPELKALLQQDQATIENMAEQVTHAKHELSRVEAQHTVVDLQYKRLSTVAESKPGLVAQQEVDDWQGKDLALESQVEASKSALDSAQSQLAETKAKLVHDQALYDYSRITAPFEGVVTQRYANYGTLMQAGTSSSTNVLPLVRLSQDDLFRLVIPVPESYVKYIRIGDPVEVQVPTLNRTFPGKVARFSVDVKEDTRTMHTEVDVPNPNRLLIPGMYAEATLTLERRNNALAVPLQALSQESNGPAVYVVNSAGRVEIRPVTTGMQTASFVEVLSGVAAGDQVIISDRSGLKAGEQVRPQVIPVQQYHNEE
jgi:RND family efflux transporter MFP subunit